MSKKIRRSFFLGLLLLLGIRLVFRFSNNKLIVIDPGHGGEDPGTIAFGSGYEKDINLEIAKRLDRKLRLRGYRTVLTRSEDIYVDNSLRAGLANDRGADLFISIHCNAMENNSSIRGLQVLYYPNSREELSNRDIAEIFMDKLESKTGAYNKGLIARENLTVLKETRMPAILFECGFLSNPEEAELLSTTSYQKKLVAGIAAGLGSLF